MQDHTFGRRYAVTCAVAMCLGWPLLQPVPPVPRRAETSPLDHASPQAGSQPPSRRASPGETQSASRGEGPDRQWIEIRNVDLGVSDSVVVRVRVLHGEVLRTNAARPAALDDPKSFRIRVTSGTVGLTGRDLGGIFNTVVFAYPGAPLRDIEVRADSSQIIQTGIMHKGVDVRFRLRGVLSLMSDGRVRIHPTSLRVLGLNGEKLLHFVGLHLDNMLDVSKARGVTVKGDDLFLDPLMILPPPAIEGRLASIGVEGSQVVETFVKQADDTVFGRYVHADKADSNFIDFRGGLLRFGKLLMYDTDLRIVDADPRTPFDMNLPHYSRQLVAGTSRTLADQGLVVHMPDYARLRRESSGTESRK